jgi:hypothetical protein
MVEVQGHVVELTEAIQKHRGQPGPIANAFAPGKPWKPLGMPIAAIHARLDRNRPPATVRLAAQDRIDGNGNLTGAQQRILDAIAWLAAVGIATPDKTQVALFADLTPGAGHTVNSFGSLRTAGLIDYPTPGTVALTDGGAQKADQSRAPQTAEEMQRQVMAKLPGAHRRILDVLINAYPETLPKQAAAEGAGLVAGAGHTVNCFGRLRSLGLIDYPTPGDVVALPVLFLER